VEVIAFVVTFYNVFRENVINWFVERGGFFGRTLPQNDGIRVILSFSEGSNTFSPCHFVVPKVHSALLERKRNGEIFAAGNGRNVVKSV
jgi:hypothetical protein